MALASARGMWDAAPGLDARGVARHHSAGWRAAGLPHAIPHARGGLSYSKGRVLMPRLGLLFLFLLVGASCSWAAEEPERLDGTWVGTKSDGQDSIWWLDDGRMRLDG